MDVNDLLVFVRVVQSGSFSRAAERLKMPVSTVSRRVAELESQLGVSLLLRTTRSLRLTEAGQSYLDHGKAIALEIEKAEALTSGRGLEPQGLLKLTATPDFGNRFLAPIVCDFMTTYPQVQAELLLTDRVVDLIDESFDLAIRMGELDDSSLLAKRVGSLDLQLYASPSYLAAHGEPKRPEELRARECIRFTAEGATAPWRLKGPKRECIVKVSGRALSNDMTMVRELAIAGRGIALMPHFLCAEDVKAKRLRVVLRDWRHPSGPIHVVYPAQRFVLPRVRAFVDHLVRACARVEWRM